MPSGRRESYEERHGWERDGKRDRSGREEIEKMGEKAKEIETGMTMKQGWERDGVEERES